MINGCNSQLDGILVNSVDPEWVATDMGGHGCRPVHEGAKGIVWAATLSDNGLSGGFFVMVTRYGRTCKYYI